MSREPHPLPMAPADCTLDEHGLAEQLDRYRQLSGSVLDIQRVGHAAARVRFDLRVDCDLVEQTLRIERACCSYFDLSYDVSARVLSITTDPDRAAALAVLLSAFAPSPSDR